MGRLPKQLKAMVTYLKVGLQVRTYSDYLRATLEAEKEDSIELPLGSRAQTTDNPPKPRTTSFFLIRKLKGNQPLPKKACCMFGTFRRRRCQQWWRSRESQSQQDQRGNRGVYGSFGKGCKRCPQADVKHCYHCNSPEHFIHNCLLVKTSREKKELNGKEGMASLKGAQTPPATATATKSPQTEAAKA